MAQLPKFAYGGQAVIEGVLIRGRTNFSLAVRRRDGSITACQETLNPLYTGRVRRWPLLRGTLALAETLTLGIKALHRSAQLAMTDAPSDQNQGESPQDEMSSAALAVTLAVSLVLGIAIFFLVPLLVARALDSFVPSDLASNLIEGAVRLVMLLGYIWGIGHIRDIRRVFAYHGAEHMVVHTQEAGLPLTVANARNFPTPHPRCGTAFLLAVVLVSIVVFSLVGRPSIEWRILSRILLLPVIAGISYEIIRFSGAHQSGWLGIALAYPGLLLQRLTTRQPDDGQVEVAICAMQSAIAADVGQPYQPSFPARPDAVASQPAGETRGK
ncbi:MAG: DUF1385 domain-containing protein [Dehalococcoidia bacterium]|nr:DUF1385 domain-containing protein [Dehalococcoidia bacterium]MSQ16901.1 DUF1385 domain-containing protein [Dehalococcoidia bacterium]